MTDFAVELNPIGWQLVLIESTPEGPAAKRAHLPQPPGVDKDLPLAGVLFMEQIDQLPGRAAVKGPNSQYMQISITPGGIQLKIAAHIIFSLLSAEWICCTGRRLATGR
jgi:hypothetical protein